jgi:type II secretory pathway component PulF
MIFWRTFGAKFECDPVSTARFYPYILLTSSVCLLVTWLVYTVYPKLQNHYTRIMRHFTFSMMTAFIILSINQGPML